MCAFQYGIPTLLVRTMIQKTTKKKMKTPIAETPRWRGRTLRGKRRMTAPRAKAQKGTTKWTAFRPDRANVGKIGVAESSNQKPRQTKATAERGPLRRKRQKDKPKQQNQRPAPALVLGRCRARFPQPRAASAGRPPSLASSVVGHAQDFGEAGHALLHFQKARLPQVSVSAPIGDRVNLQGVAAAQNR